MPALALPSDFAAGAYLLLFGTGSVAAMGTFSSLVGWIAGRPGASGQRAQSALLGLCSVIAIAVGAFWLLLIGRSRDDSAGVELVRSALLELNFIKGT